MDFTNLNVDPGVIGWAEIEPSDVYEMFNPKKSSSQEALIEKFINENIKSYLEDTGVKNAPPSREVLSEKFSDHKIPKNGKDIADYFGNLVDDIVDNTTRCGSPLMIGHMSSSLPFFHRPLAKLITAMNQNTVKLETSSFVTFLERETLAKLHYAFFRKDGAFYKENTHNPESSLGTITSGGTIANLTALWAARNTALGPVYDESGATLFEGVEKAGVFKAMKYYGYQDMVIIGSELMHYSLKKAADMLGLGTDSLITIPTDDNFRIRIDILESTIKQLAQQKVKVMAVIGVAGATETGTVDELGSMALICKKHRIHFHVDAAWGGPMVMSKYYKKFRGIELADSITVDGHKQLYTPMGCGVVIFKRPKLALSFRKTANYIIRSDSLDLGKYSAEGSRPANAIYLHASLCLFGLSGISKLMERGIEMVERLRKKIEALQDFEIVSEPALNIMLYRWIPQEFREKHKNGLLTRKDQEVINEKNCELQKIISTEGNSFVSRTTVNSPKHNGPISCLRIVIANPNTNEEHLDYAIQEQFSFIRKCEISSKC